MDTSTALETQGAAIAIGLLVPELKAVTIAIRILVTAIQVVTSVVKALPALAKKGEELVAGLPKMAVKSNIGSKLTDSLSTSISGFGQSLDELTAPFAAATAGLDKFVGALSPQTLVAYNQSVANLNATIGTAFKPVFDVLGEFTQMISGELNESMHALAPVMRSLANSLGNLVLAKVKVFASSLMGLMDFFKAAASVVGKFVDALQPLLALQAGWEALGTIFTSILTALSPIFEWMASVLRSVTEWLLLFAVGIAKALGSLTFVNSVKTFLSNKSKAGEHAAGQSSMRGIEQLNKDIQTSAFGASGGGGGGVKQSDNEKLLAAIEESSPKILLSVIIGLLQALVDVAKGAGSVVSSVSAASQKIATKADKVWSWYDRHTYTL